MQSVLQHIKHESHFCIIL